MDQSGDGDEWGWIGVVGAIRGRIVLLDVGQGDTDLVWLVTDDPARFDELISRAMPIVQSFHFG